MKIRPNEPRPSSYAERVELFKLKSLKFLMIKTDLCTLFKLIKGLIPNYPFHLNCNLVLVRLQYSYFVNAHPVYFEIHSFIGL